MDMRSSFDSRDDRHAYVGYVFQNLSAFVVNLAPNTGIGNIAKRVPIDPNNEVAFCTRQYDDLVCSILRNPVKGIHDLRMVLCRESAPPAIAVKFDNQHAVGISHHLHGAIGTEVVSLMGLHSTLPGLLGFARNDISTGSEFQPDRSSATAAIIQPIPGLRTRCRSHGRRRRFAEVTKNSLKSSTERRPLSLSSVVSALGHSRRFDDVRFTSAFSPTATKLRTSREVRFVPKAGVARQAALKALARRARFSCSGAANSSQNFAPSSFSCWNFGHFIKRPKVTRPKGRGEPND